MSFILAMALLFSPMLSEEGGGSIGERERGREGERERERERENAAQCRPMSRDEHSDL